jgi:tetratricopeptide (TPR) repeat protein
MKMERYMIMAIIMFIVQFFIKPFSHASDSSIDSAKHTLLLQGLYEVHIEKYEAAIATFNKLIEHYPQHPIGYFCTAAVYKTIMQNYRVTSFETQLNSFFNLAIQVGHQAIQNNKNDASAHFYMGGAYGFRGLHKVRKRDWWGAFKDGLEGISNLKRTVEIDSSFYDAYFGLGTYHYWRSAKSKILRLLFFRNDQKRGIDEIWMAINKGRYTAIEGKYALVAIYYDQGNYEQAFVVDQELYELFPLNPSCLYMRCRIYEKQGKWDQALKTMNQLLLHLLESDYRSIGYEVECHYRIALYHYNLAQLDQASSHVQKAWLLKDRMDKSIEIEGPFENFDEVAELIDQLNTMLLKNNSLK